MQKKSYHYAADAAKIISDDYIGLLDRDEYNSAIMHVKELISASHILFMAKSYAPSVFLSITIYEEIAKIKSGHMRSWSGEKKQVRRSKDPLFQHGKKHKIALDDIYLIGERLEKSIGKERVSEFFQKYQSGEYSNFREESLYFARCNKGLHIPSKEFDLKLAAEHLLIAIEMFSDEFWGVTGEASRICDTTDPMYIEVEEQLTRTSNGTKTVG
ncbi:AbiV family abortive infection protein [Pseudoalteromonas sp. HL-AS2]|uniref:AbiV family abortive infection protein n=1 Tax=Pseudoalteromonas sp. HL-AS2 TaxID=3071082 RepID=UPI002816053F|nr:AbiV family abortive infection protein [Pseudoalteromonas sp. HL-AS2]WMS95852.1 AbiV family abortive infection protein [Pseudoalteromonas sp. HL-AS2]